VNGGNGEVKRLLLFKMIEIAYSHYKLTILEDNQYTIEMALYMATYRDIN